MESNYCTIYQPGMPPGAKCVPCSDGNREQLYCFSIHIPDNEGKGVDLIRLGWDVLTRLWALNKCLAKDSSQGVLLGMELTVKLWKYCPEIIYIYILESSKNSNSILNQPENINTPVEVIEKLWHNLQFSTIYAYNLYKKLSIYISKHLLAE